MSDDKDRLPALYEELERLGAEAREWADVEASDSTSLVHVGSADPEKMRERMVEVRREAASKAKALREAADETRREIQREVDRQRSEMEARMRAAMEMLGPLQDQVKRMEEGIWTVGLYLGLGEEVVTLRTGEPAPIETPIYLRTSVLAMDEEVAAFPVEAGKTDWQGMDFRDVGMFDEWLIEDPEHLAQVLPEDKGIVVFTPRRSEKVYHEDPLLNSAMNEGNFESYWLIRNGENLYRLRTNFKVGRNLMPVTSEFTKLFQREVYDWETREHKMVPIEPGTREWEKAEEAQGEKQRHFMRVALIVQGLIDRTEMFQPLHAAVNVMQQATYNDGLVVVIDDTDKTLTTSREPYYDWIKRLNRELRPGMRIIGNFHGSRRWDSESDYTRIHPRGAETPPSETLLLIDGRRDFHGDKGLVVKYQRTEQVWDERLWVPIPERPGYGYRGGYKTPSRRASVVILPGDTNVIPFDLVTEEEMTEYLTARTERHAYADSFPLLQAAIKAKQGEREAEAPFRDLLTRVLAEDNDQSLDEVAPFVNGLVHRFKLGNRWHRPLVSLSQEDEAKALRLIRAEYKRIVDSGATVERDAAAVAALRKHDASIMFVGRLSSGKYVAFAPMPREHGEGACAQNLWVREHVTGKTARSIKTREWITPGVRGQKMIALFETEQWTGWDFLSGPKDDLTDPEMAEHIVRMRAYAEQHIASDLLAIEHDRQKREWAAWGIDPRAHRAVTVTARWERDGDTLSLSAPQTFTASRRYDTDFELAYGGNHFIDDPTPAREREVYMPWHAPVGERNRMRVGDDRTRQPKSTVVFEADADVLADVVKRVRVRQAEEDKRHVLGRRVDAALRYIEHQQEEEQEEVIRAKFLAEYPDEEMWAERRGPLTKNVRPKIKVTDEWHFKRREPVGDGVAHLHERDDAHLRLDRVLHRLFEEGHYEWDGLTVGSAYSLLGETVPDVYEPVAHLRLAAPDEES